MCKSIVWMCIWCIWFILSKCIWVCKSMLECTGISLLWIFLPMFLSFSKTQAQIKYSPTPRSPDPTNPKPVFGLNDTHFGQNWATSTQQDLTCEQPLFCGYQMQNWYEQPSIYKAAYIFWWVPCCVRVPAIELLCSMYVSVCVSSVFLSIEAIGYYT